VSSTPIGQASDDTNSSALCVQVLSHDRLTAGLAVNFLKSLAQALATITQYTASAVSRSNALTNLKPVNEVLQQFSTLPATQPVQFPNVENFCLGTKFVEIVAKDEPQSMISAARDVHVAALKGILQCLDHPEACSIPAPGKTDKTEKSKTNWGLVLGITGGVLVAGVAVYLYATRNRVPSRSRVR
jgi:hypothetical protein